jgi:transcriptional regulator with XRE-family HTH domain
MQIGASSLAAGVESRLKNKRIKGNTLLEAVCKSVHERREQLGISQEELAHRAGLHRTYISDIERGARNPSLKTLSRLADALEMSTSDLIRHGETKAETMTSTTDEQVTEEPKLSGAAAPSINQ